MQIATIFGIAKVRSTHVVDNRIQDDGYNVKDIESALTVEKMKEYVGVNEKDAVALFNLLVKKLEGKDISILPSEEVKQFNAEFEDRTGNVAPIAGEEEVPVKKVRKTKSK